MIKSTFSLSLIFSLSLCANLQAEDSFADDLSGFDIQEVQDESSDDLAGFEENEDLAGFDDAHFEDIDISADIDEPSDLSVGGNLAFKTSYGYHNHSVDGVNYQGFNQAQSALYLQLDYALYESWKLRVSGDAFYDAIYDIHSDNKYNDDVLDTYQTQLRLDDTYLQGSITNSLDLKIGRQIVVWGKSDSIRVTDVINPLDNRLPGLTDIEDLRLSVGMLKLDYYTGAWNVSVMAILESRIMLEAAPRGEFFPVDEVFPSGAPNPFIDLETPKSSLDNMQYAFALNGVFSGWDLSFYAADVLDQKWHLNQEKRTREVSKVKMLGSAVNIASGSWLFKSEVAYLNGVRYNSTTDAKNRLDILLGLDYMGISDTVLSLEIANRHIFDYEKQMSQNVVIPDYVDENELQTAIRATRSFMNDTLNASALVSMFGTSWEYGGFTRIWLEYDIMDALSSNVGVVDYIGGERPFMDAIKNNDRVFADITYSF